MSFCFQTLGQEPAALLTEPSFEERGERIATLILEGNDSARILLEREGQWLVQDKFSAAQSATYYGLLGDLAVANGEFEDAMIHFHASLKQWGMANDSLEMVEVQLSMARVHQEQGELEEAMNLLSASMEYFTSIQSDSGRAAVTELMAIVHWRQHRPEAAMDGLLRSLEYKKQHADSLGMARTYSRLGNVYAQMDRLEAAADYYRLSIAIWSRAQHPKNLAIAKNNLANVFLALGRTSEAEALYLESALIKEQMKDQAGLADSYINLGNFYYEQGEYTIAQRYFEQSVDLNTELGATEKQVIALKNLAYTLSALGNGDGAFLALYAADSLKTKLFQKKYSQDVAELQEKFESAEKDRQINDLQKENTLKALELSEERSRRILWLVGSALMFALVVVMVYSVFQHRKKNQQLREITQTKDRLFSIIAHNLKGPLSALEGVSGVISHYLKKGEMEKLARTVAEIDKKVYQLNALVGNLLHWARSETQSIPHRPQDLDLNGVLAQSLEMVDELAKMKHVSTELIIGKEYEVRADLNFLKTIMANLLHNAIKFTPDGGTVVVEVDEKDGMVRIAVCDTGIGISTDRLASIFDAHAEKSTIGTAGEHGTGLGLFVCKEFVQREGGEIHVSSTVGQGSRFTFTLPQLRDKWAPKDDSITNT